MEPLENAVPQPPPSFHYFRRLTPEIRDMIWKEAVRDPWIHGIQYFSMADYPRCLIETCSDEELSRGDRSGFKDNTVRRINTWARCRTFAAPISLRSGTLKQRDWVVGNESTYLHDGGLWTACKESRAIMVDHYDTMCWHKRVGDHLSKEVIRKLMRYGTDPNPDFRYSFRGSFLRDNEVQQFVVMQGRDLICMTMHSLDLLPETVLPLDAPSLLTRDFVIKGMQNIGFELADDWETGVPYGIHQAVAKASSTVSVIWLIDYKIHIVMSRQEYHQELPHRTTFHGDGFELVEFDEYAQGKQSRMGAPEPSFGDPRPSTAERKNGTIALWHARIMNNYLRMRRDAKPKKVKVLARIDY